MAEIYGFDVSHWNEDKAQSIRNGKLLVGATGSLPEFLIAKATEGRTYEDPYFNNWAALAIALNIQFGAYHFARADKNSASVEAAHFARKLEKSMNGNRVVPVLDFEGNSLKISNPGQWCADFANTFKEITGCTPMLYISAAELTPHYNLAVLAGMGLWMANWSDKKYKSYPFPFIAMKQYASGATSKSGLDENVFYGNKEQFTAYGFNADTDYEPDTACGCGCKCCMPTEV